MFKIIVAAGVAIAAGTFGAAAAPVLVNGGFESSSYKASSQFGSDFGGYGGQGVTGWSGTGLAFYFIGGTQTSVSAANVFNDPKAYFRDGTSNGDNANNTGPAVTLSRQGGNFIALDGDSSFQGKAAGSPGATISQMITGLTQGQQYDVSFEWAGTQLINRYGATTERLDVQFGTATQSTNTVAVASGGFSGWMQQSFRFTAGGASQLLSFLSYGTPDGLPPVALLDSVSITQATVPEPASWALLGASLLGLGWLVRGRQSGARPA